MSTSIPIDIPGALIASQLKHGGASGRTWIDILPRLIANMLDRWARCGWTAQRVKAWHR
jgi:hypothetical protein